MILPVCQDCGANAVVFFPGTVGAKSDLLDFYTRRPVDGFALCLPHARQRGWPNWPSEKPKRRATGRAAITLLAPTAPHVGSGHIFEGDES